MISNLFRLYAGYLLLYALLFLCIVIIFVPFWLVSLLEIEIIPKALILLFIYPLLSIPVAKILNMDLSKFFPETNGGDDE